MERRQCCAGASISKRPEHDGKESIHLLEFIDADLFDDTTVA